MVNYCETTDEGELRVKIHEDKIDKSALSVYSATPQRPAFSVHFLTLDNICVSPIYYTLWNLKIVKRGRFFQEALDKRALLNKSSKIDVKHKKFLSLLSSRSIYTRCAQNWADERRKKMHTLALRGVYMRTRVFNNLSPKCYVLGKKLCVCNCGRFCVRREMGTYSCVLNVVGLFLVLSLGFFFCYTPGTLLSDTYNISDHFCVNKKKEEKPRRFVFSLFSKPRNPHNALISEFKKFQRNAAASPKLTRAHIPTAPAE